MNRRTDDFWTNPDEDGWLGLIADWRDFVFLHFTIPSTELAAHVAYPIDEWDGMAYVSLVSFRLERLRPAKGLPPWLGRVLLRLISGHNFLNVRTYVRGPAGPGIFFLAEWINNPVSHRIGPVTHGLPYRLGGLQCDELSSSGLRRITVHDRPTGARARFVVPTIADGPARAAAPGTMEDFLFERYRAYTHGRGIGRSFPVRHAPWRIAPFTMSRLDTTLLEATFPWFRHAVYCGGHMTDDLTDVFMGSPARSAVRSPACTQNNGQFAAGAGSPAHS